MRRRWRTIASQTHVSSGQACSAEWVVWQCLQYNWKIRCEVGPITKSLIGRILPVLWVAFKYSQIISTLRGRWAREHAPLIARACDRIGRNTTQLASK